MRLLLILLLAVTAQATNIRPNIRINNNTGTNPPAASGAGGTAVALALGCSTTGSSTTIQAPAHGMGGIATDGSAALWMDTASGSQWTRITGFPTGDTITVSRSFNIAAAVDCAAGGELAGALGSISGSRNTLCADMEEGWTLTVENTGIEYSDSAACNLSSSPGGNIITDGRKVIEGELDGSGDPPVIRVTLNANYINMDGTVRAKIQNLEFIRDVAGTAGYVIRPSRQGGLAKGIRASQDTGTWTEIISGGSSTPVMILSSRLQDPTTVDCFGYNDRDMVLASFFNDCGGSGTAFLVGAGGGAVLFNIFNVGSADVGPIGGAGGNFTYNTVLDAGRFVVSGGSFVNSVFSGNLANSGAAASNFCFNVTGAAEQNSMGNNGEAHTYWGGNGVDECDSGRYQSPLDTSPFGALTDLNTGSAFDPMFTNEATLNLVPLNTLAKDENVFPGVRFPLLSGTALPVSTMTAGASQLPGAAAATAYAY